MLLAEIKAARGERVLDVACGNGTLLGCEKIPFDDRCFDLMTVCAAYHHFPDVRAFASETFRLLKTGGRLYIADVYYPALLRIILNPFVRMSKAGDVKFHAPGAIIKTFEKSGFRNVSLRTVGHIQVVVFQKC